MLLLFPFHPWAGRCSIANSNSDHNARIFSQIDLGCANHLAFTSFSDQAEEHAGTGEGVIEGIVAVDAVDVEGFDEKSQRMAFEGRAKVF